MNPSERNAEQRLKTLCQESDDSILERLAAALIGRLLDVTVVVARGGFQHGADAGPAGRQGRRFRIECKRYQDSTSLNERELLGEIDQALWRDEALDAWILVTTREVTEQIEHSLFKKGEKIGVPIVVLDWKADGPGVLAALCASAPDVVEQFLGAEAGVLARELRSVTNSAIERLKRDLQSWSIGFTELRARSIARLEEIWSSRQASNAALGQNAAVGARAHRVRREAIQQALSAWWTKEARSGAPAALVGYEGVGKTWAAIDWLHAKRDDLPITLVVPASSAVDLKASSELGVRQFLADRLHELTATRDAEHWLHRLENLLKRPPNEGPLLTVFLDGLNQEPDLPWKSIFKVLQGEAFQGRVRIAFTTRKLHWEDRLGELRGLITPAIPIPVEVYDATPCGELDQMLVLEGLSRDRLHPDLLELARTPRLFNLVLQFRERLVEAGQVTVHRLLWEYGRGTLGEKAFNEPDWHDWLRKAADRYKKGAQQYSLTELSYMASRADLGPGQVFSRLSEIVDGQLTTRLTGGFLQLKPEIVSLALGMVLIEHLRAGDLSSVSSCATRLDTWLDPISGMDQRAEILRAAVSILLQIGSADSPLASALVTSWLQTQNLADTHRREIESLAPDLINALLEAVECSRSPAHASAQWRAVNALRSIQRKNAGARELIGDRITQWFSVVSRDVSLHPGGKEFEAFRADRLMEQIGVNESGPLKVLGVALQLVDNDDGDLLEHGVALLEGFPLASVIRVFESAAIVMAIHRDVPGWKGLKWLCHLNEVDPRETRTALRSLSGTVRSRSPEKGVHQDLPAAAGALLLWLTGEEEDDVEAHTVSPVTADSISYEHEYLSQPSRSVFFPLERRHASDALLDRGVVLGYRAERARDLWADPDLKPPPEFVEELLAPVSTSSIEQMYQTRFTVKAGHDFERVLPALARCVPGALCDLVRRWLESVSADSPEVRYRIAHELTDNLVLVTPEARAAAARLRPQNMEKDEGNEWYASSQLLIIELAGRPFAEQADLLFQSGIQKLLLVLCGILGSPTAGEVDLLVSKYSAGTPEQKYLLLQLLTVAGTSFASETIAWLEQIAFGQDAKMARLAFRALANGAAVVFGHALHVRNWRWTPEADPWVNHFGTGALIEATVGIPFEQVAVSFAPWRLLEAARQRGADPAELRVAGAILSSMFGMEVRAPEHGSELSVDVTRGSKGGFIFLASVPDRAETSIEKATSVSERIKDDLASLRAANDVAEERTRKARAAGASLYLMEMDPEDFAPFIEQVPEQLGPWLGGMEERTPDFVRRVQLAEGAYLSLCEQLLIKDPPRGVTLWRALRDIIMTRFIGRAQVDQLIHIAFRGPECPEIEAIWDELLSLAHCHTDRDLMDVALAAAFNGKGKWLRRAIDKDVESPLVWRRKRGIMLEGFETGHSLPVKGAWEEGEVLSGHEALRRTAARRRFLDACARHWWREYLVRTEPADVYSAWILFLHSADRRALLWIDNDRGAFGPGGSLKWEHWLLNRSRLRVASKEREERLDRHFLGLEIYEGLGPWRKTLG